MQERGSLRGGHRDPHVEWRRPSDGASDVRKRSWPEGPGSARGSRLPAFLRRDPSIVALVGLGVMVGLVGGAIAFTVASSRGLDSLSGGEVIAGGWTLLALALAIFAVARIVMFQDLRVAGVLLALMVGSAVGDLAAFQFLPGTTTDGDLELTVRAIDPPVGPPVRQAATCSWSPDRASVESVTARRAVGFLVATVVLSGDAIQSESAPTLTLTEVVPVTGSSRIRHEGPALVTLSEPSGRSGFVTSELESGSLMFLPDVADLLGAPALDGAPTHGLVEVRWHCPQLP